MFKHRQVSRFEAESLCRQYDVSLVETSSAEDPESVTKVFHDAIREGLAAQVQIFPFAFPSKYPTHFLCRRRVRKIRTTPS